MVVGQAELARKSDATTYLDFFLAFAVHHHPQHAKLMTPVSGNFLTFVLEHPVGFGLLGHVNQHLSLTITREVPESLETFDGTHDALVVLLQLAGEAERTEGAFRCGDRFQNLVR